ncbi:MAG TPA: RsmB/NOP family class I SAM-dependent RNA methyltransferase [Opitutaceae bacterium]|nr:RsmB/NOP family class I SAM-dependent RNA methyltransferase [Opitutaceae bacterium]
MVQSSEREGVTSPWSAAVKLLTQWLETGDRADTLLDNLPKQFVGQERARAQSLLFGAIRHFGRISRHLHALVSREPRPRLRAILLVAGFEILEGGDEHHLARVVHHAVEQAKTLASEAEARLVNAVVRKLGAALAAEPVPPKLAQAEELAAYFSHPDWLVKRWLAQLGAGPTRALLEWNQRPATVYARWRLADRAPATEELAWLTPTSVKDFYEIKPGNWPAVTKSIEEGAIYLQDPSTRLSVELLEPREGETILDACAAPGGKSIAIADALRVAKKNADESIAGRVVAIDLPSPRIERLKENLARVKGVDVALVQGDVAEASSILRLHELPQQYSAVLLDVPCSNTGVMRHRVDVKWRLQENDFAKHARQQLALLSAAARVVAPGGRLVYSTCSIDAEENEKVVEAFIKKIRGRFVHVKTEQSKPWETGFDGAAAFMFERVS